MTASSGPQIGLGSLDASRAQAQIGQDRMEGRIIFSIALRVARLGLQCNRNLAVYDRYFYYVYNFRGTVGTPFEMTRSSITSPPRWKNFSSSIVFHPNKSGRTTPGPYGRRVKRLAGAAGRLEVACKEIESWGFKAETC